MVPLKYNIRSLRARKVGSLMTIFGVGMVVWASIFAFGLSAGLDKTLEIAADPLDVIVLRKGSTSEAVERRHRSRRPRHHGAPRHRHRSRRPAAGRARNWSSSPTCRAAARRNR